MHIDPQPRYFTQPRTVGTLNLDVPTSQGIGRLYQQGASKLLFPRRRQGTEAIFINTSGGLTGGDRLSAEIHCSGEAQFSLSTQGFERIYRSRDARPALVHNTLHIKDQAHCYWLPQETLFYDGGALKRHLDIHIQKNAKALIVEAMLFGRLAMGETQIHGSLHDCVQVSIEGKPIFLDNTVLSGAISRTLDRPAVAAGARAIALLIYHAPDALSAVERIRAHLNDVSGASLTYERLCIARIIAPDGLALRKMLLPILDDLTQNNLPKTWRL